MVGVLDAVVSLGSLVAPPLFDFFKKKFLKPSEDTPESTLSTLATTKPDVMPAYVESMAKYTEAKVKAQNWDVVGQVSKWVVDLRASIRPIFVVLSLVCIISSVWLTITIDPGVRYLMESTISSWFGARLVK